MNSSDGAKDNCVVAVKTGAGIMVYEYMFRRCNDAAMTAPDFIEKWRNDAVMHVAGEDKIEFLEFCFNRFVHQVNGGMDEANFSLFGWQFRNGIGEFVELFE